MIRVNLPHSVQLSPALYMLKCIYCNAVIVDIIAENFFNKYFLSFYMQANIIHNFKNFTVKSWLIKKKNFWKNDTQIRVPWNIPMTPVTTLSFPTEQLNNVINCQHITSLINLIFRRDERSDFLKMEQKYEHRKR